MAGVAVVGIGVGYIVDLVGADDKITGSLAPSSLTQGDADAKTAGVNPFFYPPLHSTAEMATESMTSH